MCIEDLRLARGRQAGKGSTITASDTVSPSFPANPQRVAIKVTPVSQGTGSGCLLCLDKAGNQPIAEAYDTGFKNEPVRIEDYGQVLTGTLWVILTAAGGVYFVQEIISQVNAPPLSSYIPK